MRTSVKSILTMAAVVVVVSVGSRAQEVYHPFDSTLFARFSFDGPSAVHRDGIQRMCFAVSRDGDYRIVRAMGGPSHNTVRLHGQMSKEDFQQLKSLVESADFRALSGDHGGLIRQESESFTAELPSASRSSADQQRREQGRRMQWLNADGENPFPAPVAKVIKWLKDFEPKEGKSFEYAEFPDVCPAGGLRLIQPTVATNKQP